jgi:hypothetical protein
VGVGVCVGGGGGRGVNTPNGITSSQSTTERRQPPASHSLVPLSLDPVKQERGVREQGAGGYCSCQVLLGGDTNGD